MTPESEALHNSAIECWRAGDATRARAMLQAAIDIAPDVAAYHLNLGVILKDLGLLRERIDCYRRAVQLAPEDAASHANLAAALTTSEEYVEAEAEANIAIRLAPDRGETWINLGNALSGQQRWPDAASAYDKALELRPEWPVAVLASAQAHSRSGRLDIAAQRYHQLLSAKHETAVKIEGRSVSDLWRAFGSILFQLRRHADAEIAYRSALHHRPNDPTLLTDLGNTLKVQGKLDAAEICYKEVATISPELPATFCNLGTVAQARGLYDEAIDCYRQALHRDPSLVPIWGNLGNCLTYSPNHGPADVLAAFRDFNDRIAAPLLDARPHRNTLQRDRRLRVGYLSPDFRKHAVAYFALPLLEGHNRDEIEVVCYYNHRQQDEWTARFKAVAQRWVDTVDLDDATLAERIRDDEIDILVDLAGHTEGNRLLVFARKPAPVQATWLGYVTTTGLATMDYRLTHADADPDGVDAFYSERLIRIPGTMWCYRPLAEMPDVAPAPFRRNGYITFGSFNRFSKVSDRVLEAWARILAAVQDSRLIICLPEGTVRQTVARFFSERGVAPERLFAYAKLQHDAFWALHADVDIALDPFPFNGGTTTCETLWLGVPLVTCTGDSPEEVQRRPAHTGKTGMHFPARFASRMGYTFLNSLGLPELAAPNEDAYVEIAVALAKDRDRLEQLRLTLRSRMSSAPLTDELRFVKEVESAYRSMWQNVCVSDHGG